MDKQPSRPLTVVREFVLYVAGLSLAAAAVFRVVDPRGEFGIGVFPVVVSQSRAEKTRLFTAFQSREAVDALLIGSSRSMKLAPAYFSAVTGLRFFNFGLDDARAEDYLAVERWVRARGVAPRLVIIGLDVEALHDDDEPDPEFLTYAPLRRAVGGYEDEWAPVRSYKRAFTTWYAIDTLMSIRVFLRPDRQPRYHYEPDGRLRDDNTEALRARGEPVFDERLAGCLDVYVRRFEKMTALSPRRRSFVERAAREIHDAGGRSLIWLTPLHPAAIARLESATRYRDLHRAAVAYLEQLRLAPGVDTLDLSDPDRFGGARTSEWDDCAHPDDAEEARIAELIASALLPD